MLSSFWRGPKAAFRYPILPAPKTAVMVPWFRQARGPVRILDKLPAERPAHAAIAATWPQFVQLIRARAASTTHSVIVLWRAGEALLSSEQRDRLWDAFHVPVFEQIIGDRGELLAAECEAHDGLHLESQSFRPAGLPLETAPCGCGRKTPRFMVLKTASRSRVAAYA